MDRAVLPLLLALAVILGGTLYVESRSSTFHPGRTDVVVRAGGLPMAREPALPDQAAAWTNVILARPLFSPSRRPERPAANVRPATVVQLPRLTGVLAGPEGVGAIFAVSEDKSVVARPGDRVGPYLIRSIAAGEVTVVGPSGIAVLHPTFATDAAGTASAAAARAPVPPASTPAREKPAAAATLPSQDFIQSVLRQQEEHMK